MPKKNIEKPIVQKLKEKSGTKLLVYNNTLKVFRDLKSVASEFAVETRGEIQKYNKDIKIEFIDSGKFEGRLQIAGDVLLFVMHTNIFEFPKEHPIMKSSYMKENNLRSFCGIIYVYNFLADTFKYNRTNDLGYLIARIFVNKDFHFIVEGKRQMEFLCNSFGNQVIDNLALKKILETAVEYCLDFDLLLPPYDNVKEVNFGDMQEYSSNMSLKTGKRLGFRFQADPEETL